MKKNITNLVYIFLNFFVIAGFILFVYFNFDKMTNYYCFILQKEYTTKLYILSSMIFVAAYLSGFMLCKVLNSKTNQLCNAYQKRHENISIENDENSAKIASLQAKIETLETALNKALNKE